MTQDELVDIVDESGNFLEVVSKREAHEKGFLHKCVVAEIIDSEGRWVLTLPTKGRQDASQYVSPMGGHVSYGEADDEALKREMDEEFGFHDFKYEFIGKKIFDRHVIGRHENHLLILYKVYSDEKPVLSHEAESYKYFTEEEIKQGFKNNPKSFGDAFHFVVKEFFPHLL